MNINENSIITLLIKADTLENLDIQFSKLINDYCDDFQIKIYDIYYLRNGKDEIVHGIDRLGIKMKPRTFRKGSYYCTAIHSRKRIKLQTHEKTKFRFLYPITWGKKTRKLVILDSINEPENTGLLNLAFDLYTNQFNLMTSRDHDFLTGLLNRQVFNRTLNIIMKQDKDAGIALLYFTHIILIDIDHFKKINDLHGHMIGDEVLIILAQIMMAELRPNDLVFRYGGEEFAIILNNVSNSKAIQIIDRLRETIASNRFPRVDGVTISAGIAEIDSIDAHRCIDKADKALYYSKDQGRNMVSFYSQLVSSGILPEKATKQSIIIWDN